MRQAEFQAIGEACKALFWPAPSSGMRTVDTLHFRKTHRRLKRTIFNQTKRDRMRIFEEILFFKATDNTKTNKSVIFLSPAGSLQTEVGTRNKQISYLSVASWINEGESGHESQFASCLVLSYKKKKSVLFNLLCVLDFFFFFKRQQSTLFRISLHFR